MLFSHVKVENGAVETSNDSYIIENLSVVSARRTLLGSGVFLAIGFGGFALAFADILWPGELLTLFAASGSSLLAGLTIGRLRFHSRDLNGSELAGVVWGTYGHLNEVRRDIVSAMRAASEDGS